MTELSPQSRKVFEAFNSQFDWVEDGVPGPQFKAVASALRAAADQVVPEHVNPVGDLHDEARQDQWTRIRCKILAIATELEAQ